MSDGAISQAEIDALLAGADIGGGSGGGAPAAAPSGSGGSSINVSVLGNFANQLKDPLAENLNKMTGASFTSGSPTVEVLTRDSLQAKLPEMVVAVMADFSNALTGDHMYLLAPEFATKLASLMTKEDNVELDEMSMSIVSEIVSKHTSAEIDELDKTGKLKGLACNPAEAVHVPKPMVRCPQGEFALFSYPVTVEGTTYTLMEAVAGDASIGIVNALTPSAQPAPAAAAPDMGMLGGMGGGMPMMGMPAGGGMPMMGGSINPAMSAPNVQSLQFPNLQGGMPSAQQGNIGLIMDVFMEMTVELGRTKKQIKDILGMGEGTIIELDKLAGEPVDILVNHKPIAKGEVVVIDENFGVRVTEILSPMERVNSLH